MLRNLDRQGAQNVTAVLRITRERVRFPATQEDFIRPVYNELDLHPARIAEIISFLLTLFDYLKESGPGRLQEGLQNLPLAIINDNGLGEAYTVLSSVVEEHGQYVESFGFLLRAMGLRYDNRNNYLASRIITDMRPVFDPEAEALVPRVMLVVHKLKLLYQTYDSQKEIFISMDRDQLEELKQVVDRALKKHDRLKGMEYPPVDTRDTI
jgi:hypothetical protein